MKKGAREKEIYKGNNKVSVAEWLARLTAV